MGEIMNISNAFKYTIPESVYTKQRMYELEAKVVGEVNLATDSEMDELLALYEQFDIPESKRVA